MTSEEKISQLSAWMLDEIKNNPYSEIGFSLTIHAGKIRKVEKKIIEKQQSGGK